MTKNLEPKLIYLIIIIVSLGNFWIWRVIEENLFIGVILCGLSILLYTLSINQNYFKAFSLLLLVLVLTVFIFNQAFDKQIFTLSLNDQEQFNKRHIIYATELKTLYTNKIVLSFYKYLSISIENIKNNLFSNLDINLYFANSHPRERPGHDEFNKYPFFLLPFFITGFILAIKHKRKIIIYYFIFATLTSSFINTRYHLGPILFFPLINVLLIEGIVFFTNYFTLKLRGVQTKNECKIY